MKTRFLLSLACSVFSWSFALAQCPANEADLADGGTFSSAGICNVAVGADITIAGAVIWNGPGILSINGDDGDIFITGSLTINSGTVRSIDNNDGDLEVRNGGSVTVAAGATLVMDENIRVFSGGSMTVSGTLTSQDRDVDIDDGGIITVNSTGAINAGDDILVQGTLVNGGSINSVADITLSSTASFSNTGTATAGDDINLDGIVTNSGTLDSNDDMTIDGTFTNSGTTNVTNDIAVNGTVTNTGVFDAGDDIDINGTMTSSGAINADAITIDGSLTSSGPIDATEIVVTGSFTSSGDITITGGGDFVVDGGDVIISGGTVDIEDDLKVYNGGSLTIDAGATVNVDDNVVNNDDGDNTPAESNGFGQGTIVVNGTLNVGGFLTINDTNPDSGLTGSGTITVDGTFTDNEGGPFDSCAGGGASCSGGPLPIELIGFSAKLANSAVKLHWSTASELNNDFFTIERAIDIERFETIGTPIKGKGTTNEKSDYYTQDENPIYGRSYYRLKQTDFDGKYTYSDLQVINYGGPRFSTLQVFPNPSNGNALTIVVTGLNEQATVPVQIFNVQGQKVYDRVLDVSTPGTLKHDVELGSPLKPGLYVIKAGQTLQLTQRIIID